MSTEPDLQNQQDVNSNQRQPMLPFRLNSYLTALTLSVILNIAILFSAPLIKYCLPLLLTAIATLGLVLYFIALLSIVITLLRILLTVFIYDYHDPRRPTYGELFRNLAYSVGAVLCVLFIAFICALILDKQIPEAIANYISTSYSGYLLSLWAWLPLALFMIYGLINLVLLGIMRMIDSPPRRKNVRHICPNKNCGFAGDSFAYRCPHCGEGLTELRPSQYGIFNTRCPHCGKKVSCSSWTGRNEYLQTCPNCQSSMTIKEFGELPEIVFIVEGAFQSGKTSFLMQALAQWSARFPDFVSFSMDRQKNDVLLSVQKLRENEFSFPTERLLNPEAYVMRYKKSDGASLAYFYDAGGITYNNLDAGVSEPFYNLANGIFLVIDPWEERGIVKAYGNNSNQPFSNYQFGTLDASSVIGRLCSKLEHLYPESLNLGFDIPLCVVVTKCDINGLNNAIGADERFTQSSNKWNAHSKQVEDFLIKHGMYNFVNVVKTRFRKKAFFAVSVLDDAQNNQCSVLNPLLWMTCNVK